MTPPAYETTLGRLAGSDATPALIATYAKEKARIADELEAGAHAEALRNLSDFVASRPRSDQRIYLLWRISSYGGDSDSYNPGENQGLLFGRLGVDGSAPLPETSLNELCAAAVDDLLERTTQEAAKLHSERDAALSKVDNAEATEAKAANDAEELIRLREELEAKGAEIVSLERRLAHAVSMLGSGAEQAKPKPRRTKVEGHTGVYLKPDGQTYEIGVPDDTGETRWISVGPDAEGAAALRAELAGKTHEEIEAARKELELTRKLLEDSQAVTV